MCPRDSNASRIIFLAVGLLLTSNLIVGGRQADVDPVAEPGTSSFPAARSGLFQRMEAAGIDVGVSVGEAGASRLLDRNGTPVASGAISPGSDAALAGAWRRYGCQVNPGNPNECPEATASAEIDCAFRERDPGCDGFLPVGRSAREAESQALPPIGSQPIPSLS